MLKRSETREKEISAFRKTRKEKGKKNSEGIKRISRRKEGGEGKDIHPGDIGKIGEENFRAACEERFSFWKGGRRCFFSRTKKNPRANTKKGGETTTYTRGEGRKLIAKGPGSL